MDLEQFVADARKTVEVWSAEDPPPLQDVVFVDFETASLARPGRPLPLVLEVAAVAADAQLREVSAFHVLHRLEGVDELRAADPDPRAVVMHADSGLLEECLNVVPCRFGWTRTYGGDARTRHLEVDRALHEWARDAFKLAERPRLLTWAGASPHALDLKLAEAHYPAFHGLFGYRVLDVTALVQAWKAWAGWDLRGTRPEHMQHSKHRALDDCRDALDVARTAMGALGAWPRGAFRG